MGRACVADPVNPGKKIIVGSKTWKDQYLEYE